MACKGCTRRKRTNTVATEVTSVSDFASNNDFKLITYKGGTYTHPIGSPTKVLEKYGLYRYTTRGKYGDEIWVHVDDIAARPDLFEEVVNEETITNDSIDDISSDDTDSDSGAVSTESLDSNKIETVVLVSDYVRLDSNEYTHHLPVINDIKNGNLSGFKSSEDDKWYVEV